ncbi:TIGR04282 family arsenosugar biosynthesis glycosyltransferase [Oceanisphaera sp.]|uniref:TIGR04282 family arsenosugar biosynthesis glycosyltransferase n=1 Tax=Oceanisphaera sp. TaxID=1929979 RepID=UPI003A954E38
MSTRIIIFAKAPVAGLAKTRLMPVLGAEGAARLAQQMLNSTIEACLAAALGPVELCMSPSFCAPEWQAFSLPPALELSEQGEGDLGQRMARAAHRALVDKGALQQQVLLVGTDCPQLSPALLRRAAQRLSTLDAVLHPTRDGGYALLGLRQFNNHLFTNMPWSTDRVANLTRQRLAALGWHYQLAEQLQDIDDPQDLFWLTACWAETLQSSITEAGTHA